MGNNGKFNDPGVEAYINSIKDKKIFDRDEEYEVASRFCENREEFKRKVLDLYYGLGACVEYVDDWFERFNIDVDKSVKRKIIKYNLETLRGMNQRTYGDLREIKKGGLDESEKEKLRKRVRRSRKEGLVLMEEIIDNIEMPKRRGVKDYDLSNPYESVLDIIMQKGESKEVREADYLRRMIIDDRNKLMDSCLRFVVSIAKGYRGRGVDFLDLIQEGNNGLMRGVYKHDPKRGRLTTSSRWWIKQSIFRAINNKVANVRVSAFIQNVNYEVTKTQEEGRVVKVGAATERLGLSHVVKKGIVMLRKGNLSLEVVDSGGECIGEKKSKTPLENLLAQERKEITVDDIGLRTEREREFVEMYFWGGLNCREIGDEFDITRERVRQIIGEALRKISANMERLYG